MLFSSFERFTIHSVEEIHNEIENQPSSTYLQRPNSPELSPPITGRDSAAPLIYATAHGPSVTSSEAHKPKVIFFFTVYNYYFLIHILYHLLYMYTVSSIFTIKRKDL